jgi:pilus assembly protein CpaB
MVSNRLAIRVAALTALIGAVLLRTYMLRFEAERSGGPTRSMLSLARDANRGAKLERALLSTREIPESYVESRHIPAEEIERILGTRLAVTGRAGEALLWSDLVELEAGGRELARLVPPGMRAITIAHSAAGSAGLRRPGDLVDVLFTGRAADNAAVTRTLLQAVLVLAVGSDTGQLDRERGDGAARGLTLGVDVAAAQVLAHAEVQGELRAVLRNPDDLRVLDGLPDTTALNVAGSATPLARSGAL